MSRYIEKFDIFWRFDSIPYIDIEFDIIDISIYRVTTILYVLWTIGLIQINEWIDKNQLIESVNK